MTTGFEVPETGLSLRSGEQSGEPAQKPVQIMRLNLVQSTLDELIESLRNDEPARVRLGKHPSLHYAGKSHSFHTYPETHRSEIYHSSSDKQNLYFTGVLSHSLEVEKAKAATAATDQALANLEESLNAFERGKESKKTHMIQHPDELRSIRAPGGGSGHRGPRSKAELEKERLLRAAASRSLTSSPTLGSAKSPAPIPTSAPLSQTKTNARHEALKTPFIHLLAVRAVSSKFLARQTRSAIEDCTVLAQKYGSENRLNREKYDLKDKSYKDLDVWAFPYPTQDDRQEAIENAVSAFDRMRISRTDKLWQMLLPKSERGKGKCLSRLNLSNGPVKKSTQGRAQVDGDDTGKDGETTGNETDRRTAPSKTSDVPRSTPTQKPTAGKGPAKGPAKTKNTNNTTLTGRVTKKTAAKPPAKTETKFKSSEFVHDSDEDADIPETTPSPPAPAQRPKEEKAAPLKKAPAPSKPSGKAPAKVPAPAKARATNNAPPASKSTKTETSTPKLESSQPRSATSTSSKRPAPRTSTSPQKPSPLGSSPPANASEATGRSRSDSQNQSSSSSSSPLISQLARPNKPTTGTAPRPSKPSTLTNGPLKSGLVANPLKRKAEADRLAPPHAATGRTTGNLDHKRRRAVSTSSGGSTGSASPPLSQEILREQLREKSMKFKRYYAKYLSLHRTLDNQSNPSSADLNKLSRQHDMLRGMKEEIWDEHARLNDGITRDF
jgi:RNA polymerase II elongation factor ELL